MTPWLTIASDPPFQFWSDEAVRSHLTADIAHRRLVSVGTVRAQGSVGGGSENASVTVTLANADGRLTGLLSAAPLKQPAHIHVLSGGASLELFAGLVARVVMGETITLTLEA